MKTLEELKVAVSNKTAEVLTIDKAIALKGRKIATIYFGYRGQDHNDEFIVGDIVNDYTDHNAFMVRTLKTAEGRNTYIRLHVENRGGFTCSDSDRFVYFIEVGNPETSNPRDVFYKDGEKISEKVINGYFESKSGLRFYNLYASFDAKLDIETGDSWGIAHPDYKTVAFPTINELLEKGLLIDHNYGK